MSWEEMRRLASSPERMQRKESLSQARVRLIEFLNARGFTVQSGQVQDALKRLFRDAPSDGRQLVDLLDVIDLRNRMEYKQGDAPPEQVLEAIALVEAFVQGAKPQERSPGSARPDGSRPEARVRAPEIRSAPRLAAHISVIRTEETVRSGRRGCLVVVSFAVDGNWEPGSGYIDAVFSLDGHLLEFSEPPLPPVPPPPGHRFEPSATKVAWDGIEFFQPYGDWPAGSHTLEYRVRVREKQPPARRGADPRWNTVEELAGQPFPITIVVPVDAKIFQVTDERDVEEGGAAGIRVHAIFEVAGLADVPLEVGARFLRDDGTPLMRPAAEPGAAPVPVREAVPFQTSRHRERVLNFRFFVPYEVLHLSHGHHRVVYRVEISRRGDDGALVVLGACDGEQPLQRDIAPTRALATVRTQLREEMPHNEKGELGLAIFAGFTAKNMARWEGRLVAFFSDAQGVPLDDRDGEFASDDGKVAAGTTFSPKSDDELFENARVFIPYSQLHLPPGLHRLSYQLRVRQSNPFKELVRWDDRQIDVVVPPPGAVGTATTTERVHFVDTTANDLGMAIDAGVTLRKLAGTTVRVVAVLSDAVGAPLKDAAGTPITLEKPIEATSDNHGAPVQLFLSYSRVALDPGPQTVGYVLELWLRDMPWLLERRPRKTVTITIPPNAVIVSDPTIRMANGTHKGAEGLVIRTSFRVREMAGWPGQVLVRFWRADGTEIKAPNSQKNYRLTGGQVATWGSFTPASNDEPMKDVETFLPYAALALPNGQHDLTYEYRIRQLRWPNSLEASRELLVSSRETLHLTLGPATPPPPVVPQPVTPLVVPPVRQPVPPAIVPVKVSMTLNEVWDHKHNELGMIINVHFTLTGKPNRPIQCNAYFCRAADGAFLANADDHYGDSNGNVAVGTTIQVGAGPLSQSLAFFLPYDQLHQERGRRHELKYFVALGEINPWREFFRSEWRPFWVNLA